MKRIPAALRQRVAEQAHIYEEAPGMEDTAQLRQSAIEKLNALSQEKLIEVLDFIDFITVSPRERETPPSALPAPDAFLECAGTWEFEPGELEEILQDHVDNLQVESWL